MKERYVKIVLKCQNERNLCIFFAPYLGVPNP